MGWFEPRAPRGTTRRVHSRGRGVARRRSGPSVGTTRCPFPECPPSHCRIRRRFLAAAGEVQDAGQNRNGAAPDADRHPASAGDVERVAQEAEPGDVRRRARAGGLHRLGRVTVQRGHLARDHAECRVVEESSLERRREDAGPERLRQHEQVPLPRAAVRDHALRVHVPRDREAELDLPVANRMAPEEHDPGAAERLGPAPDHLAQDREVGPLGEPHDRERGDRLPAHGVDVAQGVRGRDPPILVGIVHHGRDEVDRLHEREVGRDAIHARVVPGLRADEDVPIPLGSG